MTNHLSPFQLYIGGGLWPSSGLDYHYKPTDLVIQIIRGNRIKRADRASPKPVKLLGIIFRPISIPKASRMWSLSGVFCKTRNGSWTFTQHRLNLIKQDFGLDLQQSFEHVIYQEVSPSSFTFEIWIGPWDMNLKLKGLIRTDMCWKSELLND